MKLVGKKLKILRDKNNFKESQIAKYLKISESMYFSYENGEQEPTFKELEMLSDIFGCELSYFFEDNKTNQQEILACAFRADDISEEDMKEIALFKRVAKNSLKINRLFNEVTH